MTASTDASREDLLRALALVPPLAVRFYADGTEAALERLQLLVLALAIAWGWGILFARRADRPIGAGPLPFAATFAVLLPGPVAWGTAALALSFGAVFGREIFGGRPILPPAAIALAFAIFSFPQGGFEAAGILTLPPDFLFAASCLPGAALLAWRGTLRWRVALGAAVGAAAVALAMGDAAWWGQFGLGSFAAGVLFLAAAPDGGARENGAAWLHGLLVGALIVTIRLANPDQPDGVVFAVLLGGLFAPMLDRAVAWRPRHD